MDGFGGDDDFEGSNGDAEEGAMDGVMYTNGSSHPNESEMTEEDRRRFSLPSIKAQHVGTQGSSDNYSAHSRTPSTYPPAGPRPGQSSGGLLPPNADRVGSSSSGTSPSMQNNIPGRRTPTASISSLPLSTGGSSMYSQSGMTESPKPLSPAGMHSHQLGHDPLSLNRQRSPSLTTQFQQQHFGRRPSGRISPPGMSLPSPLGTSHTPKLPALAGLAPPDQRYTLSSQEQNQQTSQNGPHGGQQHQQNLAATPSNNIFQQGVGRGAPNAPSSHQASNSNDNTANLFAAGDTRLVAYVQTLEGQVKQLSEQVQVMASRERSQEDQIRSQDEKIKSQEEKITRMSEEFFALKTQYSSLNPAQHTTGAAPS
ncbi:hypothetical protein LSUE1_G009246, partial [Lachnellula suecica]